MKKIEELFASLTDHQLIIDGLSEIKVEAINKYWLGGKLQQPKGEDASTSEIKRLLLIAFAPDDSLPAMHRNAPRLRTSPTYKSDFQYYRNEENFEPAGTLTITKEFEVIPKSFYPAIFENLKIKIVRFTSDAHQSHFSTGKISWLKGIKTLEFKSHYFGPYALQNIPEDIGDLQDLESLTINRTEITSIPESLFTLKNLKKLNLGLNKITFLSAGIVNLQKLEFLDVSMNRLESIPDELSKLNSLKEIIVYENPFKEISDVIAFQTYRFNLDWDAKTQTYFDLKFPEEVLVINRSWMDVPLDRIEEIIIKNKVTTLRVESAAMLKRILTQEAVHHFRSIRCLDLQWNSWIGMTYERGFGDGARRFKIPTNDEAIITELPEEIGLMTWLEELSLKGNEIQSLPNGLFKLKALKKLDLCGNKVVELPDSFSDLVKLIHLSLGSIGFTSIPKSVFSLSKLQVLDLSWNRNIVELSPLIAELENLEELNLESNALTAMPIELGTLKKLKILSLYQNQLTSFPECICDLSGLEELKIGNQKIAALPSDMKGLKKLKKLDLDSAEVQEIPNSIGDLKNLEVLNLNKNNITAISASLGECHNLSKLTLNFNKSLTSIPDAIGSLENLEELHCYECKSITAFPSRLSKMKKLRILDLSGCQISELPKAVFELESLVELKLFELPITELNPEIKKLKNLEYLDLRLTKISELPSEIGELKSLSKLECSTLKSPLPDSFCNLTNLKNLSVSFDMVENPLPEDFGLLKILEKFDLDSRNLNQLPASFGKLDNLRRLSLRYTKFETFPLVLTELKSIGHLDLMDNLFSEVPEELTKMKSLRLIYFDNNPLGSSAAMKKKCAALLPGVYFSY